MLNMKNKKYIKIKYKYFNLCI